MRRQSPPFSFIHPNSRLAVGGLLRAFVASSVVALASQSASAQIVAWGVAGFTLQERSAAIVSLTVSGHALALRADGLLESWGANTSGQTAVPEALRDVVAIAAGGAHSIAVVADGTVICWGSNADGQCNPPKGLVDPIAVAAGSNHSLALLESGSVIGWGRNSAGQIEIPPRLKAVAAIAAAADHSVAVTTSGSVVCWGDNTYGQCTVPKAAQGVAQVSAGLRHIAACRANGEVVCWGDNTYAQCVVPAALPSIRQVSAGYYHTLALDIQGNVHCWGSNSAGECIVPSNLPDATMVLAGAYMSLAITTDGRIESWGNLGSYRAGDYPDRFRSVVRAIGAGRGVIGIDARNRAVGWGLGSYSTVFLSSLPADLEEVREVSIGLGHAMAVELSGRVRCWGDNSSGQCVVPEDLPAAVDGAALAQASVALLANGGVVAWGVNHPTFSNPPSASGFIREIDAGAFFVASINTENRVTVWGTGAPPLPPLDLGEVVDISCGHAHIAALLPNGSVRCWGSNDYGQCDVPLSIRNARSISTGWAGNSTQKSSTVVLLDDGSTLCFGDPIVCPPQTNRPLVAVAPYRNYLSTGPSAGVGLLIPDRDCDANGVRDSLELSEHDCNGNGLHDACDVALEILEDCNGNGLGDECEKATVVARASGQRGPIGVQAPVSWEVTDALPAAAPVTLRFRANGDFSGALESVELRIGTTSLGSYLAGTEDCLELDWVTVEIEQDAFNAEIPPSGDLEIHALASIAVDPDRCNDGTWIEFELEYISAAPADCNANGLIDSCEIAAGLATDANENGVIDSCESGLSKCPADLDASGAVDAADLGQLLDAWGDTAGVADIDGDGVVSAADLSLLLLAWGVCPAQ